tara:strand:- start:16880 stop:17047 length:168 start_codon:yes stop_codon:yes gene_type:complete
MEYHFIKGFGTIPNTPENKEILIRFGKIKDDTIKQEPIESDSVDVIRVIKPKRSK